MKQDLERFDREQPRGKEDSGFRMDLTAWEQVGVDLRVKYNTPWTRRYHMN